MTWIQWMHRGCGGEETPHGRTAEYVTYLKSPTWHEVRGQRLAMDRYACLNCHRGASQVHHWYYQRDGVSVLGRESMDDLASLCEECHLALTRIRQRVYGTGPWSGGPVLRAIGLIVLVIVSLTWWYWILR